MAALRRAWKANNGTTARFAPRGGGSRIPRELAAAGTQAPAAAPFHRNAHNLTLRLSWAMIVSPYRRSVDYFTNYWRLL